MYSYNYKLHERCLFFWDKLNLTKKVVIYKAHLSPSVVLLIFRRKYSSKPKSTSVQINVQFYDQTKPFKLISFTAQNLTKILQKNINIYNTPLKNLWEFQTFSHQKHKNS